MKIQHSFIFRSFKPLAPSNCIKCFILSKEVIKVVSNSEILYSFSLYRQFEPWLMLQLLTELSWRFHKVNLTSYFTAFWGISSVLWDVKLQNMVSETWSDACRCTRLQAYSLVSEHKQNFNWKKTRKNWPTTSTAVTRYHSKINYNRATPYTL